MLPFPVTTPFPHPATPPAQPPSAIALDRNAKRFIHRAFPAAIAAVMSVAPPPSDAAMPSGGLTAHRMTSAERTTKALSHTTRAMAPSATIRDADADPDPAAPSSSAAPSPAPSSPAPSPRSPCAVRRPPTPLQLNGVTLDATPLMGPDLALRLQAHFPAAMHGVAAWTLRYHSGRDGGGMRTMLDTMTSADVAHRPAVLVVQSTSSRLFGAYVHSGFALRRGYYGSPASYLWKQNMAGGPYVYPTTGRNKCFLLTEPSSAPELVMGSMDDPMRVAAADSGDVPDDGDDDGDAAFGLWLDTRLLSGHSSRCATFNNAPLGPADDFAVFAVEVWTPNVGY